MLISGPGVVPGYLDDPVATAERFIVIDGSGVPVDGVAAALRVERQEVFAARVKSAGRRLSSSASDSAITRAFI